MATPGRAAAVGVASGALTTAAVSALLVRRYLKQELRPPSLFHADPERLSVRDEEILHRLREVLLRDYWPHPVFEFNGYSSMGVMALGTMLPAPMTGEMETLRLQDGGTVLLHWSERSPGPAAPLVLILPGLGNDSRTAPRESRAAPAPTGERRAGSTLRPAAVVPGLPRSAKGLREPVLVASSGALPRGAVGHLGRQGFAAVVLNYRAVGPQELRTPRVGCADSWRDLPEVLAHVRARAPEAPLAAVGYSMSAALARRGREGLGPVGDWGLSNRAHELGLGSPPLLGAPSWNRRSMGASILLKYLGVAGAGCPLAGAMAVSAPVDIPSTAADIHSSGVKIKALPKLLASPFAKFCDLRKVFVKMLGSIFELPVVSLQLDS
ncbi:unnamed protein product [Prorocentrum cordatum]|uniref:1-alkyl-2-acetylglycerophosphocholine esterase n=1 Tax=Prorocentrum cordatum TaxID=2364126 RepID=A0ABN9PU50_9DINO|nr:unnamed protein product [Polarella glacialis]